MEKMVSIEMYCDTTGLYNEDEMAKDNMCCLLFPEKIVKEWYYENMEEFDEETARELNIDTSECNFKKWLNYAYTADDMDGLYEFAVERGFKAAKEVV